MSRPVTCYLLHLIKELTELVTLLVQDFPEGAVATNRTALLWIPSHLSTVQAVCDTRWLLRSYQRCTKFSGKHLHCTSRVAIFLKQFGT